MIKYSLQDYMSATLQSVLLIVFMNLLMVSLAPSFYLFSGRFSVCILLIIFLSLFVRNLSLPFLILFFLYIHSFFTIEPWPVSGLVGLTMAVIIGTIRHLLNFRSRASMIPVAFLGYIFWYLAVGIIISIKVGNFEVLLSYLKDGLVSSTIASIFSPLFFIVLDYIWKIRRSAMGIL